MPKEEALSTVGSRTDRLDWPTDDEASSCKCSCNAVVGRILDALHAEPRVDWVIAQFRHKNKIIIERIHEKIIDLCGKHDNAVCDFTGVNRKDGWGIAPV